MEGEEKTRNEGVVKLVSAEGFVFVIDRKAAMVSQTIRNMLTSPGGFAEAQLGEVTFPEISAPILEKICQYFYWSLDYARDDALCYHLFISDEGSFDLNPHGKETEFHIEPEMTLELMMAANYLHT